MAQNGAHLADLLLLAHGGNVREEFLLRNADLCGKFLIWFRYERKIPLQ